MKWILQNSKGVQTALSGSRSSSLAAHTETYTFATALAVGAYTLSGSFYANDGEAGAVVGTVSTAVKVASDGTLQKPNGSPLGLVSFTKVVQSVVIAPNQSLGVGGTLQLAVTPFDGSSNMLVLSPGSFTFTVASGGNHLSVTPDGIATGIAGGTATVTASVDGVTSDPATVTVTVPSDSAFTFPSGMGGALIAPSFDAVEGTLFKVTGASDVSVTALGVEVTQDGQPAETTAIFDATTGAVLASASVAATDTLADGYYFKSITPITLTSGNEYYVGTLHGTGAPASYIYDTHTATTPNYLLDEGTYFKVTSTIEGGAWSFGGGTSQYGSGEVRHYLGNFQAHPVSP